MSNQTKITVRNIDAKYNPFTRTFYDTKKAFYASLTLIQLEIMLELCKEADRIEKTVQSKSRCKAIREAIRNHQSNGNDDSNGYHRSRDVAMKVECLQKRDALMPTIERADDIPTQETAQETTAKIKRASTKKAQVASATQESEVK